jgi:hypothetical protein
MTPAIRLAPTSLYARDRDSVIVPLPFLDLPRELRLCGLGWHRKHEFHITAAHTPSIAERVGLELDAVWEAIAELSSEGGIGEVTLTDRHFICRREDDRTLLVFCDVGGLDDFYRRLRERLGTEVEPPPAHVTLYTAEAGGGGIGIHTTAQLERDCAPLPAEERGNLSRAVSDALTRL